MLHDYKMIYVCIVLDIMVITDKSEARKTWLCLSMPPRILSAAFMAEEKLMSPEKNGISSIPLA